MEFVVRERYLWNGINWCIPIFDLVKLNETDLDGIVLV